MLIIGMDLNNIVMVGWTDQLISLNVQYRLETAILTNSTLLGREEHYGGTHTFSG